MDAYLEEEFFDLIAASLQNLPASEIKSKQERVLEIGRELFNDGGVDAMVNMYFAIQNRIKEEFQKDASPYRSWWNGITDEWQY